MNLIALHNFFNKNKKKYLYMPAINYTTMKKIIEKMGEDNIITINIWGLWGCQSLIKDFSIQEELQKMYDKVWLNFINIFVTNFLVETVIFWINQWKCFNFFLPHRHYLYNYTWKKYHHNYPLKIGHRFSDGVVGSYYWKYEKQNYNKNPLMFNYKI